MGRNRPSSPSPFRWGGVAVLPRRRGHGCPMLLIRLAAQNLGRRRMRALLLGLAVALAVAIGVAGRVAGRALGDGITASFSRMGADLVVVPRGTLVNLTASLLTVQPTDETLDAAIVPRIAAIVGIARAAPQRL